MQIDLNTFIDLMSRSFNHIGDMESAKQTAQKVKNFMDSQTKQEREYIMAKYFCHLMPDTEQKFANIRKLKVFLYMIGINEYEGQNFVNYLDNDKDGFVGQTEFESEIGGTSYT